MQATYINTTWQGIATSGEEVDRAGAPATDKKGATHWNRFLAGLGAWFSAPLFIDEDDYWSYWMLMQ